jgi:hypothetical protein
VEHQSLPEYSPPPELPEGVRIPVAILYLAHLGYAFLQGRPEEEMATSYLEEYLGLLRWENLTLAGAMETKVLPVLTKRMGTYPAAFRELLKGHVQDRDTGRD